MKRRSILCLALVLALTVLLSSCGGSVSSYFDIFDKDMPFEGNPAYNTKYVALPELEGYSVVRYYESDYSYNMVDLANEEFVVFSILTDTGILSQKVLSMRSQQVVATFAGENTLYDIRFVEGAPAFFVKKSVIDPDIESILGDENVIDVTYSIYDATGNCVVTSDNKVAPYTVADLLIYDYAAYTFDASGVITKKCDVPEYLLLSGCFHQNEKYIYVKDTYEGFTVYDRDFNSVSYWCAPGYEMDECDMFVLNGGDVLVQYRVIMDDDAEKFDYVVNDTNNRNLKIDLRTVIVDAESGEETELEDFAYVVSSITGRDEMAQTRGDESFAEYCRFDNLATLMPIADHHVDDSRAAVDLVMLSDKGKIGASVKFVDYQRAYLPTRIDEDRFTVRLLTGQTAIVDKKGKILHKLDRSYKIVDKYIIGTQAIYDFDLEKVYDLRANKGTVLCDSEGVVFIKAETDNGYQILSLRDGQTTTLYTFDEDNPTKNKIWLLEDLRWYMLYNADSDEYAYYNAEGERITASEKELSLRHSSRTHASYLMYNDDEEKTYCIFTYTEE